MVEKACQVTLWCKLRKDRSLCISWCLEVQWHWHIWEWWLVIGCHGEMLAKLWNIFQEIVSGTADPKDKLIMERHLVAEIGVIEFFIITCYKHQWNSQISLRAGNSHIDSFIPPSHSIGNRCGIAIESWSCSQMGYLVPLHNNWNGNSSPVRGFFFVSYLHFPFFLCVCVPHRREYGALSC